MSPDTLTEQLSLFLDVLETGSFSAAARRHPLTPSAVARRIDNLEAAVGSRLFVRSTHAVRATPAGNAFAERARRIIEELRLARAEAVSLSNAPEGLIRIDAPAAFGRRHLAPAIADFLVAYPGLDVQLRLIDSFVDLHGSHLGEVDLVLRAGPLADTRLVATPLAYMVRIACASPPTWPAVACRLAPASCPAMTAWTGTGSRRHLPGVSQSRGKPACIARNACAWPPTMPKPCCSAHSQAWVSRTCPLG
ncbi:HTH-type transcriptional regulator DmlR [Pseudomonas sp. Teo4]|nr:HTH-type transcriptional regulator DmlR [Pseudomonas sp. Teo4]